MLWLDDSAGWVKVALSPSQPRELPLVVRRRGGDGLGTAQPAEIRLCSTLSMGLPSRTLSGGRIRPQSLPRGGSGRPLCRWCELEILSRRRRTFCSDYCVDQWRLRTDAGYLRERVFARDRGICALCRADTLAIYAALKRSRGQARAAGLSLYGLRSITSRRSLWDADHVIPVAEGGGQCDLDNLRTLCLPCHREATADLLRRLRGPSATSV